MCKIITCYHIYLFTVSIFAVTISISVIDYKNIFVNYLHFSNWYLNMNVDSELIIESFD